MSGPRVLVVTSVASPASVVIPILAALDVAGADVRALDVGRLGDRSAGAAQRVMRAIASEVSGLRLEHELDAWPPEVTLAFDPGTVVALTELRAGRREMVVAAVVAELDAAADWGEANADRFLVVDERSALTLDEHGISGERIVPVGPIAAASFASAALEDRAALRPRFKIPVAEKVVVVEVEGMGFERAGQLALELSLTAPSAMFLFSAGDDVEAATALRTRVPTLGIRAKLFGSTADVPLYYRCADVVVARPRLGAVMAALSIGARVILHGEGEELRSMATALEARGLGRHAGGSAMIGSALEATFASAAPAAAQVEADGAGTVADAVLLMARDRAAVIAESARTSVSDQHAEGASAPRRARATAAGDLEDLGGGDDAVPRTARPAARPAGVQRAELDARMAEATRAVAKAREAAQRLELDAAAARDRRDLAAAAAAEKRAASERIAMHAALARMAELSAQLSAAPSPPSSDPHADAPRRARRPSAAAPRIDDLLANLKQRGDRTGEDRRPRADVDEELEALKRKMINKKKGGT